MEIIGFIVTFVILGIIIGVVTNEAIGIVIIIAISVLWSFVFGPWAIATFIELMIGFIIVNPHMLKDDNDEHSL